MIKAYAAHEPGGELKPFEYDPGSLGDEEVEINVEYCGLCHSDLSMLDNEWGMTKYPFVPGHEVVGTIAALGDRVSTLNVGQRVGLGWYSRSCMTCEWCMSGNHNLCLTAEGTIVGRHGGFADKVRAHHSWVVSLPEGVNSATAGPLFCGGITVFNPIVQFDIKPTDRVGVIGIGGLGHMALGFLHAWGCDVTAFSTSPDKEAEARKLGANHFVNSRDPKALESVQNSFDLILSTVNADLDWNAYIAALRPKGRLHLVGVVPNPLSTQLFPMIAGQKSISGSPLGSPVTTARMIDFAARHGVEPITETFSFEQVNEAIEKLRNGKPRYRLVLKHY
ncbi:MULTISPECIES: NADPH-dependent aldehyde reductase Ahr [unclassified Coleofasciculus]|uniref:NADPH-dependent aldehyde reductase Ahr n=1 Tax=unclassified Coleofasciculus TaxID=2692782 RepID=UPI00187E1CBC|nr:MULTISPECIES: NAD(P)-dependent alcohol dehydrogenase [unclassified Coleofasciculus]MBE9127984.1 NAD(P)-dependent alcohol dehydrogenase [Coleofasciculus sp. LEGE 07081]MBE9148169.1 NAD(P)-dependent alcohol dehydrogenase [Coleofasciculus sp. LEGE 07092]